MPAFRTLLTIGGCLVMSTLKLASIGNWQSGDHVTEKWPNDSFVKRSAQYWLDVFQMVPPPWRQFQLSGGSRILYMCLETRQKSQRSLVACQKLFVASGPSMLRQKSRGAVCP